MTNKKPTPIDAISLNAGQNGLPKNPRFIKDDRFKALVQSIRDNPEYMTPRPIVIDEDGVILGGNMRYRACRELGMKELPSGWVIQVTGWSQEKKRRFILNDNNQYGEFDWELLKQEWNAEDLMVSGFTEGELRRILDGDRKEIDAEPKFDELEELRVEWETERDQVWQLGRHRLMCADSTCKADVDRLLSGARPGLMVADPPYGVEYDAAWRQKRGLSKGGALGKVANDNRADWREAWELFPGDVAYVWHAGSRSHIVAGSLQATGFEIRNLIVWAKNTVVVSRGNYHHQHEPCWYAVRKGKTAHFTENRQQSTLFKDIDDVLRPGELVFFAKDKAKKIYTIRGDHTTLWETPKPQKSETGHSTQKPVECMARPMRNHTILEVYDPFCGSGTTIIAAEQTRRTCYAMEIVPAYVAVTLQRYKDATGETPTLAKA